LTAQSANTKARGPFLRKSGTTIRKQLDGSAIPSARPTVISPASITRRVGLEAPATMASASPWRTIMPPKYKGFATRRVAIAGVIEPRAAAQASP
jgi:hypothetical protein